MKTTTKLKTVAIQSFPSEVWQQTGGLAKLNGVLLKDLVAALLRRLNSDPKLFRSILNELTKTA